MGHAAGSTLISRPCASSGGMISWHWRYQSNTRMASRKSIFHFRRRSTRCHCLVPAPRQKGIQTDMAGRVLIGDDGIWTSRKLANLQPAWARPEYAWLYPSLGPTRSSSAMPRAIWARAYAFARPDKSVEDVEALLAVFAGAETFIHMGAGWQEVGVLDRFREARAPTAGELDETVCRARITRS